MATSMTVRKASLLTEPIDLTTLGGSTPLPPSDHPIWDGPVKTASEIVDYDFTGLDPRLAQFLQRLNARVSVLEAHLGLGSLVWPMKQMPLWKRLLVRLHLQRRF